MKNVAALCVGFVAGGMVFGSIGLLRAEPAPNTPQVQVGRYQLTQQPGSVWCLDTATGDTWLHGVGGGWNSGGNPVHQR